MPSLQNTFRVLASLGLSAGMAAAEPPLTWDTVSFQAVVRGTSTLHDWSVESSQVTGDFKLGKGIVEGSLRVPVTSLSGGPTGLNGKMHAALNAEEHPILLFEAKDVAWPALPVTIGEAWDWPVRGSLTLAGTRRDMPLVCRVTEQPDGLVAIETKVELKLTDFEIKPPTFMGIVRTGDAVTVQIRWLLQPNRLPMGLH